MTSTVLSLISMVGAILLGYSAAASEYSFLLVEAMFLENFEDNLNDAHRGTTQAGVSY